MNVRDVRLFKTADLDCSRSGSFRAVLGERLHLFLAMFVVWMIIGVSATHAIADAETFRGSSPNGAPTATKFRSERPSGTIPSAVVLTLHSHYANMDMYQQMKKLTWLADSRANVKSFPAGVQDDIVMRCTLRSWANGV